MNQITVEKIAAKALESLTVTQYLLEKHRFEFAVNRAYFTMYHCMQAIFLLKNIKIKAYRKLHNAFNKELILSGELPKDLGRILKHTFKRSQRAEYRYDVVKEDEAIEAFTNAEIFFNATVQYLIANNHLK